MAGWMQGNFYAVVYNGFAIRLGLQRDCAKPCAQGALTVRVRQIMPMPDPRVVGMRMGNHCARHCFPRVDIEIARGAVKPFWSGND